MRKSIQNNITTKRRIIYLFILGSGVVVVTPILAHTWGDLILTYKGITRFAICAIGGISWWIAVLIISKIAEEITNVDCEGMPIKKMTYSQNEFKKKGRK